jgi:hypothetical protein
MLEKDGIVTALMYKVDVFIPGDCVARKRGAHFVRPCPVALRRNKALHQLVQSSSFQLAVRPASERLDFTGDINIWDCPEWE